MVYFMVYGLFWNLNPFSGQYSKSIIVKVEKWIQLKMDPEKEEAAQAWLTP